MNTDVTEEQKPELTARQRGEQEAIRRGWLKSSASEGTSDAKTKAVEWMRRQGWDV